MVFLWPNKFLKYKDRYTLTTHVLQSMPIYLMSAMNPPKRVIDQILKIMDKFFWGNTRGTKGKHWFTWGVSTKETRDIGFRSLQRVGDDFLQKFYGILKHPQTFCRVILCGISIA